MRNTDGRQGLDITEQILHTPGRNTEMFFISVRGSYPAVQINFYLVTGGMLWIQIGVLYNRLGLNYITAYGYG